MMCMEAAWDCDHVMLITHIRRWMWFYHYSHLCHCIRTVHLRQTLSSKFTYSAIFQYVHSLAVKPVTLASWAPWELSNLVMSNWLKKCRLGCYRRSHHLHTKDCCASFIFPHTSPVQRQFTFAHLCFKQHNADWLQTFPRWCLCSALIYSAHPLAKDLEYNTTGALRKSLII